MFGKCIAVTVKYPECVLVINMGGVWCGCGSSEIPGMAQAGVVLCGGGAAGGNVLVQMAEFHLQNGSLHRVEARVQAHTRVAVLLRHAVIGQLSQLGSQLIILGEKRTAIAETTQIFGRKERGASHIADSASLAHGAVGEGNLRTDGLAGVFHHIQIVVSGNSHNTLHISALAKQVHR